ncbi:nuclear transport factor 2 family protein [Modestobacter sp. L9-4]|uniref:nuclear transport factor 2 family protein n=1 Tax=Modestobacter sp. L9-4 TaxID=2851567 RepID=UPI001C789B6E|nr:nuclear transport factor 2 family protein [Modestobacter sp. L9-4]QXG74372.1 nuclear transport factor 2 family protein [Modestobacter sp. L9-4]
MSDTRRELAVRFATALGTRDEQALGELCTPDVSWTIPGTSEVSGRHEGVAGLVAVEAALAPHQIRPRLEALLHGPDSIVVLAHDTGDHRGRQLDIRVALHVQVRAGRIAALVSHMSDVEAFDSYLAP